jgi:hypothetical protein
MARGLTKKHVKLVLYSIFFLIITGIIYSSIEITFGGELEIVFDKSEILQLLLLIALLSAVFYVSVDWLSEKMLGLRK